MKKHAFGFGGALVWLGLTSCSMAATITAASDPGDTPNDPANYDKITITSNSPTIGGSDIRDIFGGEFSTLEGSGHTLFSDTGTAGSVYQVTFTLNNPATVNGYNLYLSEDNNGTGNRAVTDLELDVNGQAQDTVHIMNAGQTYAGLYGSDIIEVSNSSTLQTIPAGVPITLKFTGNTSFGPRVLEFDATVPEPSLLGIIPLGLGLLRHRSKRA